MLLRRRPCPRPAQTALERWSGRCMSGLHVALSTRQHVPNLFHFQHLRPLFPGHWASPAPKVRVAGRSVPAALPTLRWRRAGPGACFPGRNTALSSLSFSLICRHPPPAPGGFRGHAAAGLRVTLNPHCSAQRWNVTTVLILREEEVKSLGHQ